MTDQRLRGLALTTLMLTACTAAVDGDPSDPGATEPAPTLPGGDGSAAAASPDTEYATVCYVGEDGSHGACAPLVSWSSSWGSAYSYPSHGSAQYTRPLRLVDLSAADPNLRIAPNFVLGEVLQEWKGRYGVFQRHVVNRLQAIRDEVGGAIHINSAYRSPAYNRSVDGATYSRHMFGDAADMRSNAVSLSRLGQICEQHGASYVGLYSTFVHCDWRNHPLDEMFYSPGGSADIHYAEPPEHTATLDLDPHTGSWVAPATGFDEGDPLRLWTAYDDVGDVIDTFEGERYTPPTTAARVLVQVGGQVEVEVDI